MLKFDVDRTEKGKSILIPCQDKLLRVQRPDSDSIFQFHEFVWDPFMLFEKSSLLG